MFRSDDKTPVLAFDRELFVNDATSFIRQETNIIERTNKLCSRTRKVALKFQLKISWNDFVFGRVKN